MAAVIVLKSDYDFWTEATIQKTIKWILAGKAEIVEQDETKEIGSVTFKIKMPLIVRLLEFAGFKAKREEVPFSANAVYQRDRNLCQYWHKDENGKRYQHRCTVNDRTIDHVIPVSRGGKSSFGNCVCACRTCNEKVKKNRTPAEAGLKLVREPQEPKRDKSVWVRITFPYNPGKVAHRIYFEKYLKGQIAY